MRRSHHIAGWRAMVTAELGPGEDVSEVFAALIPPPDSGEGGLVISLFLPLLWAYNFAAWRYAARAAGRKAGVPLAPRMIVAVTPARLVIWTASRRWRPGRRIGDLQRDKIVAVTAPGTGKRLRSLVISLGAGATITLRVAPGMAEVLVDRLAFQGT